jgi:hypothetical protein
MCTNAERSRRWYKEVWKPGGESTVLELMAENIVAFMEGVDIHGRDQMGWGFPRLGAVSPSEG